MDTILKPPDENYYDNSALAVLSLCGSTGVNKFSGAVAGEVVVVICQTRFVLYLYLYFVLFYFQAWMLSLLSINMLFLRVHT